MSNDIVKVRLQYKNKTTLAELDASRSVESIKSLLRALWEAMEEPPITVIQKTPQVNIDPDFLRSPEVLDSLNKFACPFGYKDHNNCPDYFPNGKCIFGRHTPEQVAVAPQCPSATNNPETNS